MSTKDAARPSNEALRLYSQACDAQQAGDDETCERMLWEVVRLEPRFTEPRYTLARLLERRGIQGKGVLALYKEFVDLAGDDPRQAEHVEQAKERIKALEAEGAAPAAPSRPAGHPDAPVKKAEEETIKGAIEFAQDVVEAYQDLRAQARPESDREPERPPDREPERQPPPAVTPTPSAHDAGRQVAETPPSGPVVLTTRATVSMAEAAKAVRKTLAGGLIKEEQLEESAAVIHWPLWQLRVMTKKGPLGVQKAEAILYIDGLYGRLLDTRKMTVRFITFVDEKVHRIPGLEKIAPLQRAPLSSLSPSPQRPVLDEASAASRVRQLFGVEVLGGEIVYLPMYRFTVTHKRSKQTRIVFVDTSRGRVIEGLSAESAAPAPQPLRAIPVAAVQPEHTASPAAPSSRAFDLKKQQSALNRERRKLEKIEEELLKLGVAQGAPVLDLNKGQAKRLYRKYQTILQEMYGDIAAMQGSRVHLEQMLTQKKAESDSLQAQSRAVGQRFMGGLQAGGMTAAAFDQLNPQYNREHVRIWLRQVLAQAEWTALSGIVSSMKGSGGR